MAAPLAGTQRSPTFAFSPLRPLRPFAKLRQTLSFRSLRYKLKRGLFNLSTPSTTFRSERYQRITRPTMNPAALKWATDNASSKMNISPPLLKQNTP